MPHEVKCPTCRQISKRPTIAVDGYLINIGLIRAIDNYLIYENEIFKKKFGQSLNCIDCSKCNAKFDTLSNYHHHIRGDSGHLKCRESLILCYHCRNPIVITLCIDGICKSCINSFYQINSHYIPDNWDDPSPIELDNLIPPIIDLSENGDRSVIDEWNEPVPLAAVTVWD